MPASPSLWKQSRAGPTSMASSAALLSTPSSRGSSALTAASHAVRRRFSARQDLKTSMQWCLSSRSSAPMT